MRDAVDGIHAVDDALVQVQKTTGYTGEQLDTLTDRVYALAQSYGRAAGELLDASANFARAGFGEQLEQMTELSALLQNVGDLTAQEASDFLIASNAAWQLNGNYESMLALIDGLNNQTNDAAVTMLQLTSAIQVAGSVFAASGESAQMFAAMVGAAEAATQRGGAEIGRALRTIAMRTRQVKGEVDGEIIDAEAISNAAKALDSVGISVANAQGELRLTSDILDELAGKWETLDGWQKSYLAQQLAGQRQANVLVSLLENWSEVERQAGLFANGAGSAMRENQIYLDSWTAKSKALDANFTQLVSHMLDTQTVKDGLDILNTGVDLLDTGLGRAATTGAAAAIAINGLAAAFSALSATAAGSAFLTALVSPVGLIAGATIAGISLLTSLIDEANVSLAEQEQEFGYGSEYETLKSKADDLTEAEQNRLNVLQAQNDALKDQIELANRERWDKFNAEQGMGRQVQVVDTDPHSNNFTVHTERADVQTLKDLQEALAEITQEYKAGTIGAEEYQREQRELIAQHAEYYDTLRWAADAGYELSTEQANFIQLYENSAQAVGNYTASIEGNTEAKRENAGATDELTSAEETLKTAFDEVSKKGNLTYGTLAELDKIYPGLSAKILDASGKLTEQGQKALESKAAFAELIAQETLVKNFDLDFTAQIAELDRLETAALGVSSIFAMLGGDVGAQNYIDSMVNSGMSQAEAEASYRKMYLRRLKTEVQKDEYLPTPPKTTNTGTAKTEKDARLEALKQEVADAKALYDLMEKQGASAAVLETQAQKVQDALHRQRVYLTSINAATSEQLALSAEWWTWQERIIKAYEDEASAAEKAAQERKKALQDAFSDTVDGLLDDLDALRDAEVETLQRQLDKLTAQHDAVKSQREEEEKLLAVEKARIALQNAQTERTVRQFNSATGQWEWVANAKTVADAEKELADAQKEVSDYRAEQLYQAQKEAIEKQIKATKEAFDAQKKAWQDAAKAVKNGSMSVDDGMSALKKVLDSGSTSINAAIQKLIASLKGELQLPQVPEVDTSGYSADYNAARNAYLNGTMSAADAAAAMEAANRAANEARGLGNVVTANEDIAAVRNGTLGKGASGSGTSGGGSSGGGASSAKSVSDYSADYNAARSAYLNGTMSAADAAAAMEAANKGANALRGNGSVVTADKDIAAVRNGTLKYDGGGILHGLGGIKATQEDEMVVPSDLTKVIIKPALNNQTAEALDRMRVIYGLKPMTSLTNIGGSTTTNSGDSIGTLINIGGIKVDTESAKYVTLSQVAQWASDGARSLPLHYNH